MIPFDRKVLKSIRKFTNDLDEPICFFDSGIGLFDVSTGKSGRFVALGIDSELANEAAERLLADGYLKIAARFWGGKTYYITSKTVLYHQFVLEEIKQKFWFGFASGVLTTVATEITVHFLQLLLSKLFPL